MKDLPGGWLPISLGEVGTLFCGQSPATADVNTTGVGTAYVTGPEQWDGVAVHRTKWTTDARRSVPEGCIFVTVKGAGVGTLFPGIACAIGRDVYAYLPNDEIDRGFVLRALTKNIGNVIFQARGAIPGLSKDHILGEVVGLPPLAEQRRIVAKLDALNARTDRARTDLDRVPILAERYRLALLRSALRGHVTEGWRVQRADVETAKDLVAKYPVPLQGRGGREATTEVIDGQAALAVNDPGRHLPNGWAWIPLLRVARQETGHTPSRSVSSYWDGGVPWIGIRDAGAHHGAVISETLQTISKAGLDNSSARLLPKETVCLSRTASVGYVTIMGRSMATSQDFATWTCNDALNPKYLMYALMAEGEDIRLFGKGTTHTTIYFPEIRALHIALAPIEEQAEIVRIIETGLAKIDRLVDEAAGARRLLDRLDQAILAKGFRGELVPQDPADEPASVLLDRIRAERASAPAKLRRGRRAALAA